MRLKMGKKATESISEERSNTDFLSLFGLVNYLYQNICNLPIHFHLSPERKDRFNKTNKKS